MAAVGEGAQSSIPTVAYPTLSKKRKGDSCQATLDKTACAPFSKERRMKFTEPSKLNRNPGEWAPLFRGASYRALKNAVAPLFTLARGAS
jgi:hypothetical protein